MSVISDVHETFISNVLDEYAITRFRFHHGHWRHKKKKKMLKKQKLLENATPIETLTRDKQKTIDSKQLSEWDDTSCNYPASCDCSTEKESDGFTCGSYTCKVVLENEAQEGEMCASSNVNVDNKNTTVIYKHIDKKDIVLDSGIKLASPNVYCANNHNIKISQTLDEVNGNGSDIDKTVSAVQANEACNVVGSKRDKTVNLIMDKEEGTSYDSDGDLNVTRTRSNSYSDRISDNEDDINSCLFITIRHKLATELDAVGEQVWHGALVLCDYICDQRSKFEGQLVVDLGAGTGLTSIVAAMFASHVFCTDTGDNVLHLARCNIDNAVDYFRYDQPLCAVDVRELNWLSGLSECDRAPSTSQFNLNSKELATVKGSTVLLAADVIYDDDITDAFFSTIKDLMSELPNKTLYISLEKRLVFTIEDLAVTSPAYNHFKDNLNKLVETSDVSTVTFTAERLDVNFNQFFQYNRTDYMIKFLIKRDIRRYYTLEPTNLNKLLAKTSRVNHWKHLSSLLIDRPLNELWRIKSTMIAERQTIR